MTDRISPRLQAIVDALPIEPSSRVLEIGCGPAVAARAVAAIAQALHGSAEEIATGRMAVRTRRRGGPRPRRG